MGTAASRPQPQLPEAEKPRPLLYIGKEKVVSLRSRHPITCYFRNKTSHSITLMWVDYQGGEVPYGILRPGQEKQIFTYLTHPWTFRSRYCGPGHLLTEGREVYLPSTTKLEVVVLEATLFHVWTPKTHHLLFKNYAPFNAQIKTLLLAHKRLSNLPTSGSSSITSDTQRSSSDSSSAVETAIVSAISAANTANPGFEAAAASSSLITWVGRLTSPMCSSDSGSPSQLSFLHSSPGQQQQQQQQQIPIPGISRSWETAKPNDGSISSGSSNKSPEPRHSPSIFDRLMSSTPSKGKSPSPVAERSEQSSSPGNCMLLHALLRGLKRRKDDQGPSPPTSLPPGVDSSDTRHPAGSGDALATRSGTFARRSLFTPAPQLLPVEARSDLGVLPLDVLLCVIPFFAPRVPVVSEVSQEDMMMHPPGMTAAEAAALAAEAEEDV